MKDFSKLDLFGQSLLVYPSPTLKALESLKGNAFDKSEVDSLLDSYYKIFNGPNIK